jgi:hypothetical protein
MASPAGSNRSLGSDFTPDPTPISSSTPSEVDPTELRDEDNNDHDDGSDNGDHGTGDAIGLNGADSQNQSHNHSEGHGKNAPSHSHPEEADNGNQVDRPEQAEKPEKVFRDYANACDRVKNFYAEQHTKQTMEYNQRARNHFHTREKMRMSVWQAVEKLNELVDDSDPDVRI